MPDPGWLGLQGGRAAVTIAAKRTLRCPIPGQQWLEYEVPSWGSVEMYGYEAEQAWSTSLDRCTHTLSLQVEAACTHQSMKGSHTWDTGVDMFPP